MEEWYGLSAVSYPSFRTWVYYLPNRYSGGRIIPGVVVFSVLGFLGQSSYNMIDEWQLQRENNAPTKPLGQRIVESRWMPFRVLTDEQYREILDEKLLSVEAEIAMVDEKIDELRKSKSSSDEKTEP